MAIFDKFRQISRQRPVRAQTQANGALIDEKSASPMAIIYRSELDYLSRCVLDYPNIETGGQLFGYWTSQGAPVVLYAIGPGRNANHQPTFFNQDVEYLDTVGNELLRRYTLQHIGEWHSHHQLGLARPSGHDAQTMYHGLQTVPLRRMLLCICNYRDGLTTVNPYNFHENELGQYADASWRIVEMTSPFRPIIDQDLASMLIHPVAQHPAHGQNREFRRRERQPQASETDQIKIAPEYWLVRNDNVLAMKRMVADVSARWPQARVDVQAGDQGIVQISVDGGALSLRFGAEFPETMPEVYMRDIPLLADDLPLWYPPKSDAGIAPEFRSWFAHLSEIVMYPIDDVEAIDIDAPVEADVEQERPVTPPPFIQK